MQTAQYANQTVVYATIVGQQETKNIADTNPSHDRIHVMLDSAPVGCWFYNSAGTVIDCNQHAVSMFEMDSKGEMNRSSIQTNAPLYQPSGELSTEYAKNALTQAVMEGTYKGVWMAKTKYGREFACEISATRIEYQGDYAIIVYLRETHEDFMVAMERKAEKEVQQRLHAMLDSSPMFCAIFDEMGNVLDVNQASLDFFGFQHKHEYIENFYKLSPEFQPNGMKTRDVILGLSKHIIETGEKICVEWMQQTIGGDPRPIEITLVPVVLEGENRVIAHARDLRTQHELKKLQDDARQRLQAMLNSSPLVCCLYDDQCTVLEVNNKVEELFELPDKQLFIERFRDLMPARQPSGNNSHEKYVELLQSAFATGRVRFEWMYQTPSGQPLPCEEIFERVRLGDKDYVIAYIRDLREQIRMVDNIRETSAHLELALEQANAASEAKSNFLSTMSHEMRTPMNAVIGMTAVGKKTEDIDGKNRALDKINDAASHLLGVINDILDMAKIESGKMELVPVVYNFSHMLRKVFTLTRFHLEEKQQIFTINVDNQIPMFVVGDAQRLAQALTNVMSNAIKYTKEGGTIALDISLASHKDNVYELKITVSDNGIGIPADKLDKLFTVFEQVQNDLKQVQSGTGLGLPITKSIVEMMGGQIWVESAPGKGTTITFTVQVGEITEAINDSNADDLFAMDDCAGSISSIGIFKGKRMLIAEDVEINREILITLLEDSGIIIECAETGKDAVDMIAQNKYDLVLMDIQMPEMNGLEATKHIRTLYSSDELPIIALTANVFKDDIESCRAVGMSDHIGKPYEIDMVFNKLKKHLL